MSGLSLKPNRFGWDPFLCIDTAKANYFFGRTDVPPDTEEGQRQALLDASKDVDPEVDRTLPWGLLMGGMYSFLYRKAERENQIPKGDIKRGVLPKPIRLTPMEWAEAFNIITVRYVETEHFKRPDKISEQRLANGRKVKLLMLLQDPGKGAAKSRDYYSPDRLRETKAKLRRMERHRQEVGENSRVKKYLAELRTPAVN